MERPAAVADSARSPGEGLHARDWPVHPVRGTALRAMRRDLLELLTEVRDHAGDFARIRVSRLRDVPLFLINHPQAIQEILVTRQRDFVRGEPPRSPLKRMLGNGLLIADGEFHMDQRRLLQPIFQPSEVRRAYEDVVRRHVEATLLRWQQRAGELVDMAEEMQLLTVLIIGEVLLGQDLSRLTTDIGRILVEAMQAVQRVQFSISGAFPGLPTPANRKLDRLKREGDAIVRRLLEERRQGGGGEGALYSVYERRGEIEGEVLHDQMLIFIAAGHETTANMLAWTWLLLAQYPLVLERLQGELDSVLAGRLPGVADLEKLPFTANVLRESLRLYPPAWVNLRRTLRDTTVMGHALPAQSGIVLAPFLVQRDPRWWDEPERFDPDRFEGPGDRPRFTYFPFGGGPRQCIGQALAEIEGQLALAALAQRFAPTLEQPPPELEPLITLRPRGGLRMRLVPR